MDTKWKPYYITWKPNGNQTMSNVTLTVPNTFWDRSSFLSITVCLNFSKIYVLESPVRINEPKECCTCSFSFKAEYVGTKVTILETSLIGSKV